jgi:hypothetical protein
MRVAVTASDLTIGDMIPGVGKVRGIARDSTTVAITLDWATTPNAVLSADHVIWIDRDDAWPIALIDGVK